MGHTLVSIFLPFQFFSRFFCTNLWENLFNSIVTSFKKLKILDKVAISISRNTISGDLTGKLIVYMLIIWKYFFLYSMKSFLDLSKSLFDAELIYNLSSLDHCDILHLLRSDWSNMARMQVSHPHVILFLLIVGFIYFGMYLLSDVSPIHIFPSTVLTPEKPPSELGNIMSLCSSFIEIWSRFFVSLPEYH